MAAFIDLTGKTFGRLTVLEKLYKKGNEWYWKCQCSCGNFYEVRGVSLREGKTKSCGCLKQEKDRLPKGNVINEIGNKYGHLTVVARAGSNSRGQALWECECDCESKTHIIVLGNNLRRGHTQSCGCDRRSHGEKRIEQLLRENGIHFIQEYRPFKFSSGKNAAFDFYVENNYIIEYDGETHFGDNLHGWHTEEGLKAQQERDIIKNEWCKKNHIPLICIPYWHLSKLTINDLLLETTTFLIK